MNENYFNDVQVIVWMSPLDDACVCCVCYWCCYDADADNNICKDPHFHFILIIILARLHDCITKSSSDGVHLEPGQRDASGSNTWVSREIVGQFSQAPMSLFLPATNGHLDAERLGG